MKHCGMIFYVLNSFLIKYLKYNMKGGYNYYSTLKHPLKEKPIASNFTMFGNILDDVIRVYFA